MTDTIEEIKETGLELAMTMLADLTSAATKLVESHGQDAVDLVLMAGRIDALSTFIPGFIWCLLAIGWYKIFKAIASEVNSANTDRLALQILSWAGGLIFFILSLKWLLNLWAWVGIFYPEIWLFHKAVGW
jgi:hypothetical protein